MTKLEMAVGLLVAAWGAAAEAQTVNMMVLNQAGAQAVLQAAERNAQRRNAPSAIAVVNPDGDLIAFQRMDGTRPDRKSVV